MGDIEQVAYSTYLLISKPRRQNRLETVEEIPNYWSIKYYKSKIRLYSTLLKIM